MNIKNTKKPETRIDVRYLSSLGIKTYGANNLYPQELHDIVSASSCGRTCLERRITYIEGNGLASQSLSDFVCNTGGETVDDVHSLLSADCGEYEGIAIHVNYNIAGNIVSLAQMPFECVRLEEEDEQGIISHVIFHPDWRGKKTRNGKSVKVDKQSIEIFPVFNPDPAIVQAQIIAAGGIEFYKGQVLYISRAGRLRYPIPAYDTVLTDMSTDEGLSNVSNRNVRNNFLAGGILWVKRGQMRPLPPEGSDVFDGKDQPENNGDNGDFDEFIESIESLQGDTNSCKIAVCEGEVDEEKPEFISFAPKNFDKEFDSTNKSVVEKIYAAFNQEMFARLRTGSIGFSGDLANDVKKEYCEQVTKYQRMLTRAYNLIFSHWEPDDLLPFSGPDDIKIEPLVKSVTQNPDAE